MDLAKGAIRAKGEVVIVEGYMDVLQAHQAGFGNVVASMGTALTEHQLALLKRMTKRYILALDPDLAGDQGTLRGLTVARQTLDEDHPARVEGRVDAPTQAGDEPRPVQTRCNGKHCEPADRIIAWLRCHENAILHTGYVV